ncbi:hypothetical protein [Labrys sp. ZIDIC5]|uniref:hypothetical protein n=1 Tax=Labrys sedimenti TaxID=3106036 RepID=UPI002ACA960F|nr:hypothetical protein [Labrys sp. ZIDIC5]MDZ5448631.1 hypothetical protein [Labrys sp. ZIDIC5]
MTDQEPRSTGSGLALSKQQIVLALADVGNPGRDNMVPTITGNVDPLAADAGSAQWLAGGAMVPGDAVFQLIQTATGWSASQMDAFMELARSKTV